MVRMTGQEDDLSSCVLNGVDGSDLGSSEAKEGGGSSQSGR